MADHGTVRSAAASGSAPLHLGRAPEPSPMTGKVAPPRRVPNAARRTREHLTPDEVERLVEAAGRVGRHGHRDRTLILLAYQHRLRLSELVALRWEQADL